MQRNHPGHAAGTHWNPSQYLQYSDHRLRPALELMDRIPLESPRVIVDLGCGTGNVTRILAERWPSAKVYGLDNSKEMLHKAQTEPSHIVWQQADAATWRPNAPAALIYSNAALHWVDQHPQLFPRLVGFLQKGGCLAVQMPLSWSLPSHRLMRETLADCDGRGHTIGTSMLREAMAEKWTLDTEAYYDLLAAYVRNLDIWETEYLQILEGEDPVFEWVQGTGLRPILNGLTEEEKGIFLAEYRRRLNAAYPTRPDGRTLYGFRRLFIVALV